MPRRDLRHTREPSTATPATYAMSAAQLDTGQELRQLLAHQRAHRLIADRGPILGTDIPGFRFAAEGDVAEPLLAGQVADRQRHHNLSHQHNLVPHSHSAGRRADPHPVAVRVTKPDLASPGHLFNSRAELLRDRLEITQTKVDQRVRASIAGVLGQKQPHPAACDRHERREARLEAVLPLLAEAQPLVPGGGCGGVADAKDRDDFELPRVSRTGNSRLIYAAVSIPSSSSMTSRGVLYPSVE
jgi:hypothetical protein